ncbi:hypothetical protein CH063_02945, partial [Colletotrichum higginsianum]
KWSTLSLTLSLSLSLTVLASHSLTPPFLTAFARLVIHIRQASYTTQLLLTFLMQSFSHLSSSSLLRPSFGHPPALPSDAARGLAPPPPLPRPPSPIPCRLGRLEPDDWPAIMQPAAFFSVSYWCHMYGLCPSHAARQRLLAPLGMPRRSKATQRYPWCIYYLLSTVDAPASMRIRPDSIGFDLFLGLAGICHLSVQHVSTICPCPPR